MSLPDSRPLTPEEMIRQLRDILAEANRSTLLRSRILATDITPNAIEGRGIAFASGVARSIPHKLGRTARGWFEVYSPGSVTSAAHVGLRASAHPAGLSDDTHITMTPTNTGVCFLLVF